MKVLTKISYKLVDWKVRILGCFYTIGNKTMPHRATLDTEVAVKLRLAVHYLLKKVGSLKNL